MGKTIVSACAVCGPATGQVENDLPTSEQDDDTGAPIGWAEVRVRRVVPNPEHADFAGRREALINGNKQQIAQHLQEQGQAAPDDDQLTAAAADAVDMQIGEEPASSILEAIGPQETPDGEDPVFFLCPTCLGLLAKVGGEFAEEFAAFIPAPIDATPNQPPQGSPVGVP